MPYTIIDGDTVPYHNFEEVEVVAKTKEYRILEYRVRKVYPYAMIASALLEEFHTAMDTMESGREKKRYVKQMQEVLAVEFEDELKKLSVQQGIILMKLIYRESGITSYEIVKQLRGGASAMLWQGTAKLYGSSMKQEYDPEGEDKEIEEIVQQIESGELKPFERRAKTTKGQEALSRKEARKEKRKKRKEKKKKARQKKKGTNES